MFDLLSRFDWALYIVIGSPIVAWVRSKVGYQPAWAVRPLVIANRHWLVHGVGAFVYPDLDSFARFNLRLGILPWLLVATIVFIWVAFFDWLFRHSGAELLVSSPDLVRSLSLPGSADGLKLAAIACLLGGVLGLWGIVYTATTGVP